VSEAGVELVRRIYEEFNETRELPRWALVDDLVWEPPADEPDNAVRRGVDAVSAYVHGWAASFATYRCDVEELIDLGDWVVAPLWLRGTLGAGTEELSLPLTQAWEIRGGKVVAVREFRTRDEALAALG
jgi:ketosteroid isomerase-like protein